MITFIEQGDRIATENFDKGEIYKITYTTGNYRTMCCIGIGSDFVMFQGTMPNALFCLTIGTSETVATIELGGGGSGTMNYNELENKPQINGVILIGNKTASDLNLVSQNDLDNYVTDTELTTELADYATTASVVSALASKQDTLTTAQLTAVNSGITSSLVTQIGTNTTAISGKQDTLTPTQLIAVNSGITSADVAQITTNKNNISSSYSNGYLQSYNLYPYGTLTGTGSLKTVNLSLPAGTYKISWKANRNDKSTVMTFKNGGTTVVQDGFTNSTSKQIKTVTLSTAVDSVEVYSNDIVTLSDIMIIDGTMADSTPYRAYTMSNAEITAWILSQS